MKTASISTPSRQTKFFSLSVLFSLVLIAASHGADVSYLSEDFESGDAAWTLTDDWGLTTEFSHSPTHALTDSHGSYYLNNTDASAALASDLDLGAATRPVLAFHHRFSLESGYDFARVEVSTDSGATWLAPPLAEFTGESGGMVAAQLDLSAYVGESTVRIRFRLVTDGSVTMDGWVIDDVVVGEAPAPVTLTPPGPGDIFRNHIDLNWFASTDPDFAAYIVLRSRTLAAPWADAVEIARIDQSATTNFTDISVSPKTTYHYRVLVENALALRTESNEESATTLPGMDFPFLDTGEAGPATWIADAPWALSNEESWSPDHAWSDSPASDYADGLGGLSLTLSAPMDLSGSTHPTLSFVHCIALAAGDNALAEISTDGGATWNALTTYTSTHNTSDWQRQRISLDAYRVPSVLVRFRLTTDASTSADGWHIDEISVAEAPEILPAPVADQITSSSVRLSWGTNSHPQVVKYAIFRSTTSAVGITSTFVGEVPSDDPLTLTDTGLILNTDYYYRVYAVTSYGCHSDDSATPVLVHTLSNPIPWSEDAEGALLTNWDFGASKGTNTWATSSEDAQSGSSCLADSPNASYEPNQDTWIETSVDLSGSDWPVLVFWDRYDIGTVDWFRLEISAPGKPTVYPYGVGQINSRSTWRQHRIDLSQWKGSDMVKLRFRLSSNSDASTGDGWLLDQLSVTENTEATTPLTLPFTEDFENSALPGWLAASWHSAADPLALDGASSLKMSDATHLGPDVQRWIELENPITLPADSNVQATFWIRGLLNYRSRFRLQYSENDGSTWADLAEANLNYTWDVQDTWTRRQASLHTHAGKTVRLRFMVYSYSGSQPVANMRIDKFTLAEMPAASALTSITPALRSMDLVWDATTLGIAFQRYELWRSTTANVSMTNGEMVFESTNPATTSTTDSNLNIGGTYYYNLFTVDERGTYIPSNELSATTVPVVLPFADSLDSADNWVIGSNNANPPGWGVATTDVHEGSGCLATAPVGQYAPSTDSYVETSIDLTGADWPVLEFWDRYDLGASDWFRLEISAPGKPTIYPYGVGQINSRSTWRRHRIDLSQWKGASNVRLRFHFVSDGGATPGDGWFLDQLSVAENTEATTPLTLPFTEDFENSALPGWLAASWHSAADTLALDGASSLMMSDAANLGPDVQRWIELENPITLPAESNVQATFWIRGLLNYRSGFRLQYSENDGSTWADLAEPNLNYTWDVQDTWTRRQASLHTHAGKTVRLRFMVYSYSGSQPVANMRIDKFTLAEMPAASALTSITPALRSMDLVWDATTLGTAFQRYELWRSTSANVSVTNGEMVFQSTNPATASATDSNLNIGGTYYYKVFIVDERGTYIPSNELSATTVPVVLPFADSLDSTDNWVIGSNNANPPGWGVATTDVHEGSGCLATAPVGQYAPSTDSYVETSIDLTGANWPVLTFWDRYDLGASDWFRLEISAPGKPTVYPYGVGQINSRSTWRQHRIDLSQWKGASNVRLRFHFVSDGGATPGDGWFLDQLSVAENTEAATPLALPFTEDFENAALPGWLAASWHSAADPLALDGASSLMMSDATHLGPDVQRWIELENPIALPADSNVQATFWIRGLLNYRSRFRLQYSENDGSTWADLAEANLNYTWDVQDTWTRRQASLHTHAGKTVRLRFMVYSYSGSQPVANMRIDKFTLAEMPSPVTMLPIDQVAVTSQKLNWQASTLPGFSDYRIHRSNTSTVTPDSTLVGTITDSATTSFIDTGLDARTTYYYRVYLVDDRGTWSPSDLVSGTTLGMPIPLNDDFDSYSPGWTFTGDWQRLDGVGRNGSTALVDSDGDYAPSTTTHAVFAVNLAGMNWPVLRFWDKHAFAGNSWGRIEISTDGTSWPGSGFIYGVKDTRTTWQEQTLDLSPWKDQSRVFIRFRRGTDGNLADGWTIDDLSITDHPVASTYPVFDGFESETNTWLSSSWTAVTDIPHEGSQCLLDTPDRRYAPDTMNQLVLAQEVDLSGATAPQLTFFVRGNLSTYSRFRVQVSTNGGIAWSEIAALNLNNGYIAPDWEKKQVSLDPWLGQIIRLRILTYSYSGSHPASDIFLDNIGIGEEPPLAPTPESPADNALVDVLRPTLTVTNAIDHQSDLLTYRFEVYSDSELTQIVAQVPAVASGTGNTSWQVDVNLNDHASYWWRCQANDGDDTGPWSPVSAFLVNEANNPPNTVEIAAPVNGGTLWSLSELLIWRTTDDPDPGDAVFDYQIEIDDDHAFASPLVSVEGITVTGTPDGAGHLVGLSLDALDGIDGINPGAWFWRIRARDTRYHYGEWSAEWTYFRMVSDYERYLHDTYSPEELLDPAISGPNADPDHDGIGQMMEFACNMDPNVNSLVGAPSLRFVESNGEKHIAMEFNRRIGTDLRFRLQESYNMNNWSDTGAPVEVLGTIDDETERCRMLDPFPISTFSRRFLRVEIGLP